MMSQYFNFFNNFDFMWMAVKEDLILLESL